MKKKILFITIFALLVVIFGLFIGSKNNTKGKKISSNPNIFSSVKISAENYGDYVNYPIDLNEDGDSTNDWRIFYSNEDGDVFIIADDYVKNTSSFLDLEKTGLLAANECILFWKQIGDFKNINAEVDENIINKYMMNFDLNNTNPNSQTTKIFLDSSKWDGFVDNKYAQNAIGTPTLEMFVESWNNKGYTKLYCNNKSEEGFYVGMEDNPTTTNINLSATEGYSDTLYFPHTTEYAGCKQTWLASPSAESRTFSMALGFSGTLTYCGTAGNIQGIRPVVMLKSGVLNSKDNNVWKLK